MDYRTAFKNACSKPEDDEDDPKNKTPIPGATDDEDDPEDDIENDDEDTADEDDEDEVSKKSKSKASAVDNRALFARRNATSTSSAALAKFQKVFGQADGTEYYQAGLSFEQAAIKQLAFYKEKWSSQVIQLKSANSKIRELEGRLKSFKGTPSAELSELKSKLAAAEKKIGDLKSLATKQERELLSSR